MSWYCWHICCMSGTGHVSRFSQLSKGCFPSSSVQYCIQRLLPILPICHSSMYQSAVSESTSCMSQLPEGSWSKNFLTIHLTDAGKSLPKGSNSVTVLDAAFVRITWKWWSSENTTTGLGPDLWRLSLSVCEASTLLSSCVLLPAVSRSAFEGSSLRLSSLHVLLRHLRDVLLVCSGCIVSTVCISALVLRLATASLHPPCHLRNLIKSFQHNNRQPLKFAPNLLHQPFKSIFNFQARHPRRYAIKPQLEVYFFGL